MAIDLRADAGARRRRQEIIALVIKGAGHWLMEVQPGAAVKAVRSFLDAE